MTVERWRWLLLLSLGLLTILSVGLGIRMRMNLLFAIPIAAVMGLMILYNYRVIFYLLIFSIPFSIQIELAGGFAMDMFSEPLMLVMLGIFLVKTAAGKQFSLRRDIHPFHLLLFLLIFWTFFTSLLSEFPIRSFKFFLAKVWYLAAFVYVAGEILQRPEDFKRLFWAFFSSMVLVVIGITIRHALTGFSYAEANGIAFPLYANGVHYSATIVLFLPWIWFARTWYTPKSLEWYLLTIGVGIFLIATFFAYKRGAYLAVLAMPVLYFLLNRKFLDKLVYAGVIGLFLTVGYLVTDNNFYQFAPNYGSTVWHGDDFEAHLEATFSGTEISGMERFYRWVAAKNMVADMPWIGSGPSTFNQVYKRYADDAFRTYVSDNPEQSTTHNYFLMTFAEQGFIGGLLFLGLSVFMYIRGIQVYHRLTDPVQRNLVATALLSLFSIVLLCFLNELIEVDKIGPMFWIGLLLIYKAETWQTTTES